jgi:hypothetical protein
MKQLKLAILLALCLINSLLIAQTNTQNVRGLVVDKISQSPIAGAIVQVMNATPAKGTTSDYEGNFLLKGVNLGVQSFKVTFVGYKEILVQNVTVNAGKELVLTIQLEEDIKAMAEVVVTATTDKNKPLNEMSAISTRTFSVEETQKFAAAVNDPGRMATSFAGVVNAGDGGNMISIRGNSPNGLMWRMEGVEIPNPNHFSAVGNSGGGVSILSAQLLGNSDFSTGAFAAEYGNALSGVFDLKLRKGNNQKREYTLQLGVLGADFAAEGPFKKGYGGSYLINYRYSTLNILSKIGVPLGDAITNFQDLSFNVFLPTKNLGNFSLFGFGGLSYQITKALKDSVLWEGDDFYKLNTTYKSNTGAVGLTQVKLFHNKSYLKTALVFSGTENGFEAAKIESDLRSFTDVFYESYRQGKITLSSTYTKKISAKSSVRTGVIFNQLSYNLSKKSNADTNILVTRIAVQGSTHTAQAYVQLNHKFNQRLSSNLGMHYLHLFLNNSFSFEPRANISYLVNEKNTLTLGYGLHGQIQPIGVYFAQSTDSLGATQTLNKQLELSKAHHVVLGYDWVLNNYSHLKTELYYQHLFDIPISNDVTNTYSILNSMDGFYTQKLVNKGLGRNYGLELTYERFLHRSLYYLVSASLYDSKYKAANGIWYNTQFNTNFAFTVTLGKEWVLKGTRKDRVLGANFKSVYVGGYRNTPIDLAASKASGETVLQNDKAFENKNPNYYRLDIRVSIKRNYKKLTSTLALDIQNTTNRQNIGGQYYNAKSQSIVSWYQTPLIPILSYKLEF